MAITLDNSQKVMITAQALDKNGNQTDFTAPPSFSVVNPALATLTALDPSDPQPPTGQVSMWLVPVAGQTGSDTVSVTELAVLEDPTTTITGTLDYTITAAAGGGGEVATSIAVTAGTPQSQAGPAPQARARG